MCWGAAWPGGLLPGVLLPGVQACVRTRACAGLSAQGRPRAVSQKSPHACLKRWIRQRKQQNHQHAQAPNDCLFTFFFFFSIKQPPHTHTSSSFPSPHSAPQNRSTRAAEPETGGEQRAQKLSVASVKSDAGGQGWQNWPWAWPSAAAAALPQA